MQAHSLSNIAAQSLPPVSSSSLGSPGIADAAGLAHDAGNLMGALTLYSDLLRVPGVLRPEHQHYAVELRTLSERSSALLHRLISNAQGEPEPGLAPSPLVPAAHNARLALRSLEPLLQRIAEPFAHLTVVAQNAPTVLPFPAEVLERILLNLVRNSADALRRSSTARGRIHIEVEAFGKQLKLTVSDNGPGMDPWLAARFVCPEPRKGRLACGLGHRIVHQLVQQTGASLELRVRPARGCVFLFTWDLGRSGATLTRGAARAC